MTTGGAILAIQHDEGVLVAGDTLGAYGSLARFRDIRRIIKLNKNVLLTYTGDVADFQFLLEYMEETQRESEMMDDGIEMGPIEIFNLLERIMYNRRSKGNPLWNIIIIT